MLSRRSLPLTTARLAAGAVAGQSYHSWAVATEQRDSAVALSSYFESLAAAGEFSGAVLITKNGRLMVDQAYGLADRANGVPNRTDTKFNLGSMNKMFTAVAVGQLVEQGKLTFDDTVARWLPDRAIAGAERITLHHLLTHTSGLGDFFGPRFFSGGKDLLYTVLDYFALFETSDLAFEPGTRWSYSNAGFIVLGAIVERASGEDYFDYVRGHIFRPTGMPDTDSYLRDEQVHNLATGYTRLGPDGMIDPGPARPNTDTLPARGSPAGGGYSTTHDLQRFADALLANQLVGAEMTRVLTTGKVDIGPGPGAGARYAYGFFEERRANGERVIGHGGGAAGISAGLDLYVDRGMNVAILTNQGLAAERPRREVYELLGPLG